LTLRVAVIGAGVAGVAAAWSARRAGHAVTVIDAGAGASALGSGAVDDVPWEDLERAARILSAPPPRVATPLSPAEAAFVEDLGLWHIPSNERPWIATAAGRLRPVRGLDHALLNLGGLEDALVLLPRVDRAGWDADAIASGLAHSAFARAQRIRFRVVDTAVLRFDDEHRAPDADLAARHDDPGRIAWLAGRLREGLATPEQHGARAVLLGPWLGASASRAAALSTAVGVPCGEALVGAGSPAGLRFEAARARLLEGLEVRRVRDRALRVMHGDGENTATRFVVTLAERGSVSCDAVVLAIGGLAGGGLVYAPAEHEARASMPPGGKVPFELSLEAPVELSAGRTQRMGVASSLLGPELDMVAWPSEGRAGALEAVGVRCDANGVVGPGLRVAGDLVAGRPRTVLEAVVSGIAAGARG
jgi:glycerol-3-phosphate dehydrogenase subunit B